MTDMHVSGLDQSVHKTNEWLKDLKEELHQDDDQIAYTTLRGTLHAIRDRLPTRESADFASQLPTVLRGVYYENWIPDGEEPRDRRSRDTFLSEIRDAFRPGPEQQLPLEPEDAVRAVSRVLDRHVTEGQMRHVRSTLPDPIRDLMGDGSDAR